MHYELIREELGLLFVIHCSALPVESIFHAFNNILRDGWLWHDYAFNSMHIHDLLIYSQRNYKHD